MRATYGISGLLGVALLLSGALAAINPDSFSARLIAHAIALI